MNLTAGYGSCTSRRNGLPDFTRRGTAIGACFQQVRGESVPQRMHADPLGDARLTHQNSGAASQATLYHMNQIVADILLPQLVG